MNGANTCRYPALALDYCREKLAAYEAPFLCKSGCHSFSHVPNHLDSPLIPQEERSSRLILKSLVHARNKTLERRHLSPHFSLQTSFQASKGLSLSQAKQIATDTLTSIIIKSIRYKKQTSSSELPSIYYQNIHPNHRVATYQPTLHQLTPSIFTSSASTLHHTTTLSIAAWCLPSTYVRLQCQLQQHLLRTPQK